MENILNYVDPMVKDRVIDYIMKGPWTLLLISDEPKVQQMADELIVMDAGKLAFKGTYAAYLTFKNK
jgi:ABC-type bacteriocin/lantibiotic exporter with double-glycine peptidase domain